MGAVAGPTAAEMWRPDHVVVLIEENHAYDQVIANPAAPYINKLAREGALFTNSHGVQHPSQPNYLALFSGATQGISDDRSIAGTPLNSPNLGAALIAKGYTFAGYSEGQPGIGSLEASFPGGYGREHNPWSNWQSDKPAPSQLSPATNLPWEEFPKDFDKLTTVAFIVPSSRNDEHGNGQIPDQELISTSDRWLETNIAPYARWAIAHNSLLIITWDEDNYTDANRVATIMIGARVKPGKYDQRINHFNVLRTIEDFYDLPLAGESRNVGPITGAIP
jgi:acid phosphatase